MSNKTLKYWEQNANEDYIKTPISVLKYITELESRISLTPMNSWLNQLTPIITDFKDGNTDPLDGDEAEDLIRIIGAKINLNEGNITDTEYNAILDGKPNKYVLSDSSINGTSITVDEDSEFQIIDVDSEIDSLCMWIGECRDSSRELMKTDLGQLMSCEDEYVFSSTSTNDYVDSTDSRFNEMCENLLK